MHKEMPFFFLGHNQKRLFGIWHEATNEQCAKRDVIICCHPMFGEKLHSHRILVNFARFAMQRGFSVLRFDFCGTGESEGLFQDNGINTWLADLYSAITWVNHNYANANIFVLGLRVGASLALLNLQNEKKDVAGCVLWEPIFNLKKYLFNLLRSNLSAQMVEHKEISATREDLVELIGQGKHIDIDGYLLGNPFWKEVCEVDLPLMVPLSNYPILLYQISPSAHFNKEFTGLSRKIQCKKMITIRKFQEKKFWLPQHVVYPSCEELFNGTIEWMQLIDPIEC